MSENEPESTVGGGGLLGQLAVRHGLLTSEQLGLAVKEQAEMPRRTPLGEILVNRGWVTRQQLDQLLHSQEDGKRSQPASAQRPYQASEQVPSNSDAQARSQFDDILMKVVAAGAADLHIHGGAQMFVRTAGQLKPATSAITDPQTATALLEPLLDAEQRRELDETGQVDLAYELMPVGRFRGNLYRQHRGLSGVFRHIPPSPPTLDSLGLPHTMARFANFHQGLVLITGPAGAGKTTTAAALVNLINEERSEHILTVEDPVEFVFESKASTVNQRQVRRHTQSFASALRGALREDPDVIFIGELRDRETISLALTAAETGHLVIATQTTPNAIRTIEKLIGVFPSNQQSQVRAMVSESLRGVVSQRLVPRRDGKGRVAALELLTLDPAIANLIREEKTFQIESVLQTGARRGQKLLDISLLELLSEGTIDREQALRFAVDEKRFAPRPSAPEAGGPRPGSPAGRPSGGGG